MQPLHRSHNSRETAEKLLSAFLMLSAGVAVCMHMMTDLFDLITPRALTCPNKSCKLVINGKLLLLREMLLLTQSSSSIALLWSTEGWLKKMCMCVTALVPLITSDSCPNYKVEVSARKKTKRCLVYSLYL